MTEAVCEEIKDEYSIEDGEGYKRDVYLKEHNIKSFFIVPDADKQKERQVSVQTFLGMRIEHMILLSDSGPIERSPLVDFK